MKALPSTPPTPAQLRWQQAGFGLFCHFGINTFFGKEWSDGSLPASGFNPTALDARQWVDVARSLGMKYLILTAKHHDGFCLWPTETTGYSVRSSPWKNGKGDVVSEVAEACREAGMAFGIYLSPWDRHEACYPDAAAYDDFYCRQLTELCTRYGELFELWFDGAGSEGRVYDWNRIMNVAGEYQPDAMIFNMGRPTIRWAGNEDGVIDDPVRYAVTSTRGSAFTPEFEKTLLEHPCYLPPECDVAIRQNWFWQGDDVATQKSVSHLLAIWYRSVGMGANLLLNVPPDRRGLLDDSDVARLLEVKSELDRRFANPMEVKLSPVPGGYEFEAVAPFDHLELFENLDRGQGIEGFRLKDVASGAVLASGQAVGSRRVEPCPLTTSVRLLLELEGPGSIDRVRIYHAGHSERPPLGPKLDYGDWAKKADRGSSNE